MTDLSERYKLWLSLLYRWNLKSHEWLKFVDTEGLYIQTRMGPKTEYYDFPLLRDCKVKKETVHKVEKE